MEKEKTLDELLIERDMKREQLAKLKVELRKLQDDVNALNLEIFRKNNCN